MRRLLVLALLAAGCNAAAEPIAPPPEPPAAEEAARAQQPDEQPAAEVEVDQPAQSKPSAVSALTGRIALPADGGKWPVTLGVAPPPIEGKAVRFAVGQGTHKMVVSPESGRFVLAQELGRRADKSATARTRFVLGDLTTGKVLGDWEVTGPFEPLDLNADGTRFAAKVSFWSDPNLTVFTVTRDYQLTQKTVIAHDRIVFNPIDASANSREMVVRWAGFVGTKWLASAAEGGQVRLFSADSLERLGTLDGTPGLAPCVTPDRKLLIAHAGGKAVLLDPARGEAVAAKAWPLPSGQKALAASPDGATLACARDGRVRFLTVKTGEFWDQMIPQFGDAAVPPRKFSWAGPEFLVYDRKVYDPALSYPVWRLAHPTHADAYTARQTWTAARLPGSEATSGSPIPVAVRAFDALPPDLSGIVAAGKARPGIHILPAGAAVRVDATALPATKQAWAKADLEQRLRETGYTVNATAAATFTLSLDPPVTKTTDYTKMQNVPYTYQPLRVQFRHEGKVVFERVAVKSPPGLVFVARNETLASKAAAEGWGQPNYESLKTTPIPPHFPGRAFPAQGFGYTELAPDGPTYRSLSR